MSIPVTGEFSPGWHPLIREISESTDKALKRLIERYLGSDFDMLVLTFQWVGEYAYCAVRVTPLSPRASETLKLAYQFHASAVFALIAETGHKAQIYKISVETQNPEARDCPRDALLLLSPTTHPLAIKWRLKQYGS